MRSRVRRRLFARIAASSIALGASGSAAAAELAKLPEDLLSDVIEEVEAGPAADGERQRVLRWIASDARPFVRAHAATAAGALWPEQREQTLELLRDLACDRSEVVRTAAAAGLARLVRRASPVERIQVVCEWAVSDQPSLRAAIARALVSPTPAFVTDLAIESLAGDADPEVRALALTAAAAHFEEAPQHYRGVAEKLANDEARAVRRVARAILARKSAQ
jgi:hypothetical protein